MLSSTATEILLKVLLDAMAQLDEYWPMRIVVVPHVLKFGGGFLVRPYSEKPFSERMFEFLIFPAVKYR